MNEIDKYIPLDKSWIIRGGILDLVNNYKDIKNFLSRRQNLGDDLMALRDISIFWNNSYKKLNVGESGTLYRFVRFALWKQGIKGDIIEKEGFASKLFPDQIKITQSFMIM